MSKQISRETFICESRSLTFLYEGGDGKQRNEEAEGAIDAQEDLVETTCPWVGVVQTHEDHSSHRNAEQHQSHQGQRGIPQAVMLHSRAPALGRRYRDNGIK